MSESKIKYLTKGVEQFPELLSKSGKIRIVKAGEFEIKNVPMHAPKEMSKVNQGVFSTDLMEFVPDNGNLIICETGEFTYVYPAPSVVNSLIMLSELKGKNQSPVGNIDPELLKSQRSWLRGLEECDEKEGLLNLLDVIADYLVDVLGFPESKVFETEDD